MLQDLLSKIEKNNPQGDVDIVKKAYEFAAAAHEGQKRQSGEDYIIHPVEVAEILADLNLDCVTIAAGILHDVIEDTDYSYDDIKNIFSEEIAMLVDGVTKLTKLEYKTKEEQQAENLRKMFIAMAKDIRVILIKLADRLHNMRTLKYMPPEKQKEKASETMEIYAPIAHRLGISKIKWEMEDLALRYLEPTSYYELVEKVAKKRKEREDEINHVMELLREKLKELGIEAHLEGRPKSFNSIYRKMYYQNKTFEQIFDLTAVRVIVDSVKDCYGVLGIVHTLWKPIPGRFKDYIAMPKPNMYQSLHTTVFGHDGQPFEVQIRTWEMHRTSELGIAAHWKYKEGRGATSNDLDEKLKWLRQMLEWQNEVKDTREFMETLKIDLFMDEVYVFTPKGDVVDLPVDSNPIDFAYKIHSQIGNKCVGAKVNGRIVPIDYKLQNGDIVEIITATNSNGPSRDWLKLVRSSQAKNKIRQWFKKEKREENIIKGREMLEKEIKRHGFVPSQLLKSEWLEQIYKRFSLHSIDDLYSSVGYGGLTTNQIITRLKDEYKKNVKPDEREDALESKLEKTEGRKRHNNSTGIRVKGIENVMVRFSKCCNPVPGDEIMGYITKGRGVSVHRSDCPNVEDLLTEPERIIEVEWNTQTKVSYNADVEIRANDRKGLLAEITSIIDESKLNISSFHSRTSKDRVAIINFIMEINDIEQLNKLIRKFRKIEGVMDVFRAKQ